MQADRHWVAVVENVTCLVNQKARTPTVNSVLSDYAEHEANSDFSSEQHMTLLTVSSE